MCLLRPPAPSQAQHTGVWAVQEEQDDQEALQLAKEAQEKEFEILRTLMEEATDQEIEELRAK